MARTALVWWGESVRRGGDARRLLSSRSHVASHPFLPIPLCGVGPHTGNGRRGKATRRAASDGPRPGDKGGGSSVISSSAEGGRGLRLALTSETATQAHHLLRLDVARATEMKSHCTVYLYVLFFI